MWVHARADSGISTVVLWVQVHTGTGGDVHVDTGTGVGVYQPTLVQWDLSIEDIFGPLF